MAYSSDSSGDALYNRALLLHGSKRNEVLTLAEVQQHGADSFGDPDYVRIYGATPPEWYGRGVRLLGRTAVECTRDQLADRIGRDIAEIAAQALPPLSCVAIDPFAGSCNTLFWILRHLPNAQGLAFELDALVHRLTESNLALMGTGIRLHQGDYQALLPKVNLASETCIVVFIAPPWGKALDEAKGLDLRGTIPPITEIIQFFDRTFPARKMLFAIQVYEKVDPASLSEAQVLVDWSELRVYAFNVAGKNHGLLLATKGWRPQATEDQSGSKLRVSAARAERLIHPPQPEVPRASF
jgi:hypothetical protein